MLFAAASRPGRGRDDQNRIGSVLPQHPGSALFLWMSKASWVLLAAAAVVAAVSMFRPVGPSEPHYEPSSTIPRTSFEAVFGAAVASPRDFVAVGDTVFLLDWRSRVLFRLEQRENRWVGVAIVDRQGGGPGEFESPASMDGWGDTLAVLERSGELELFSTAGEPVGVRRYDLPCPTARPQFVTMAGSSDVLYATECRSAPAPGLSADTVYKTLWRLTPDRRATMVHAVPTMSRDGSWGYAFSALWPVSYNGEVAIFGSGIDACAYRIGMGDPTPDRVCGVASELFESAAPAGYQERLPGGRAYEWRSPMQPYVGLFFIQDDLLLVRPFSPDSMLVESPRGERLVVGPLSSLVECNRAGCLWYKAGLETDSVAFLKADELRSSLSP